MTPKLYFIQLDETLKLLCNIGWEMLLVAFEVLFNLSLWILDDHC